jgi:hypothetical protein
VSDLFPKDWYGNPISIRLRSATLFLDEHEQACGPNNVDFFRAIVTADASLFALVSIKDLVNEDDMKDALHASKLFSLLQCMRNITAHHEVWISNLDYAWSNSSEGGKTAEQVKFYPLPYNIDVKLIEMLNSLGPKDKKRRGIELAREYMSPYVSNQLPPFYIKDVLRLGIQLVSEITKIPA